MTMGEVRQNESEHNGFPLENMKILSIGSGEVERSYNTFTYTAQVELENRKGKEVSSWLLEIKPELFTFLVEGHVKH